MTTYKRIKALTGDLAFNADLGINATMDTLEEAIGDRIDIVDASSPYMFAVETLAVSVATAIEEGYVLHRRQYPKSAQSAEDLYIHMSDEDFFGAFSKPGSLHIQYGIPVNDLERVGVLDSTTGNKRLIIPRDTVFINGDTHFYIHYPIVIDVLTNGDIQIYFDLSIDSPIANQQDTIITYNRFMFEGTEYIGMQIPTDQLRISSLSLPVNAVTGFKLSTIFQDKFCYARAYITKDGDNWEEIKTTHTEQTYDPAVPTMVISVAGTTLKAFLPEIYITSKQAGIRARVDIHTTKGDIEVDYGSSPNTDWIVERNDFSGLSIGFTETIGAISSHLIWANGILIGGTNGLTLEQLKQKVVYGAGNNTAAITETQLRGNFAINGYGVNKQKDTISERVYVANAALKAPVDKFIASAAGVANSPVAIDKHRTDVSKSLIVNGKRATITPDALFKVTGGGTALMPDTERQALSALNNYALSDKLNEENYLTTPFHYVLDETGNVFSARAYFLDAPKELSRTFAGSNSELGYSVTTRELTVTRVGKVYTIKVVCSHPSGQTGLHLQILYRNVNGVRHYINATQSPIDKKSSAFTFVLNTTLDFNGEDQIELIGLTSDAGSTDSIYAPIDIDLELIYMVETNRVVGCSFDNVPNASSFAPLLMSSVTYEKTKLQLGRALPELYMRSKPLLSPPLYETHKIDVPLLHEEDVFDESLLGVRRYTVVGGKAVFTKLATKGDPYTIDGVVQMLHTVGSVKYNDVTGLPIEIEASRVIRELRITLIDAKIDFGTVPAVIAYGKTLPLSIVGHLDFIKKERLSTIERTTLFFEPAGTDITSAIRVDANNQLTTRTSLKFTVDLTLTKTAYNDTELRESIELSISVAIKEFLTKGFYAKSLLIESLRKIARGSLIDVDVTTSLPSDVAYLIENNASFSIRNRIRPLSNGLLTVEDDITFRPKSLGDI